jgi:hypothetical protein
MQISGAARREITKSYFGFDVIARSEATKQSILSLRGKMDCFASLAMTVSNAPHSQPSSPAKAGDPVFRGASDRVEKLRRTGYSAFAEYDGSCWSSAAIQVHHARPWRIGAAQSPQTEKRSHYGTPLGRLLIRKTWTGHLDRAAAMG